MRRRGKFKLFNISRKTNSEKNGEKILIGCYGYWVILTYICASVALIGMYYALTGRIRFALICLMVCGLCDGFDGKVASLKERTEREKSFGIQIDAFADIISFGVFPAIIGLKLILNNNTDSPDFLNFFILIVYILAALIRLAYFNVIEAELVSRNEKRIYFEGMPVTSVALIIPIVYSICDFFDISLYSVYGIMLLVLSIAFVLKIKIPKPRGRYLVLICLAGLPAFLYLIFLGK